MRSATLRPLAVVALVLASGYGQPAAADPNPLGEGPSDLPADVIKTCQAAMANGMSARDCLEGMGWPVGPNADAEMPSAAFTAWGKCKPPSVRGEPMRSRIGYTKWQPIEFPVFEQNMKAWHRTRFDVWPDVSDISQTPSTLKVLTRTEFDVTKIQPLFKSYIQQFMPENNSCAEPLHHGSWRFDTHGGVLHAGFDTTIEKWTCIKVPTTKVEQRCAGPICTKVPWPSQTDAKTRIGRKTVGTDVYITPTIENGHVVLSYRSAFDDRGGIPGELKALGFFERLWNKATFNTKMFRSNNKDAAAHQLREAADLVVSQKGELLRRLVGVPGLDAIEFQLLQPRFVSGSENKRPFYRLQIEASAEIPFSAACKAVTTLNANSAAPVGR